MEAEGSDWKSSETRPSRQNSRPLWSPRKHTVLKRRWSHGKYLERSNEYVRLNYPSDGTERQFTRTPFETVFRCPYSWSMVWFFKFLTRNSYKLQLERRKTWVYWPDWRSGRVWSMLGLLIIRSSCRPILHPLRRFRENKTFTSGNGKLQLRKLWLLGWIPHDYNRLPDDWRCRSSRLRTLPRGKRYMYI